MTEDNDIFKCPECHGHGFWAIRNMSADKPIGRKVAWILSRIPKAKNWTIHCPVCGAYPGGCVDLSSAKFGMYLKVVESFDRFIK